MRRARRPDYVALWFSSKPGRVYPWARLRSGKRVSLQPITGAPEWVEWTETVRDARGSLAPGETVVIPRYMANNLIYKQGGYAEDW